MPTIMPPTKGEVLWRAAAYLSAGSLGLFVMLAIPPDLGVRSVLGYWSTILWAAFMSTSLVAVYATLRGQYRVEYIVLPLFGVALLVASVVRWFGAWYGFWDGGVPDWQQAMRAASITALFCLLVARYVTLRRIIRAVKAHELWTTAP